MKKTKTMNELELKFYEAGINEAHEQGCIVPMARSSRASQLLKENNIGVVDGLKYIVAYDKGVAFEIHRQTRLEYKRG